MMLLFTTSNTNITTTPFPRPSWSKIAKRRCSICPSSMHCRSSSWGWTSFLYPQKVICFNGIPTARSARQSQASTRVPRHSTSCHRFSMPRLWLIVRVSGGGRWIGPLCRPWVLRTVRMWRRTVSTLGHLWQVNVVLFIHRVITLSSHLFITPCQYTLSSHLVNTPCQITY